MKEVAAYFFKLGLTGFGGPLAVVAQIQNDLVIERKWISESEFRRVFGLIKAMPGPLAFQVAVYLGRTRAGWRGALIAGFCLVFPAFLMMIALAMATQNVPEGPGLHSFLKGTAVGAFILIGLSVRMLAAQEVGKKIFFPLVLFSAVLLEGFHWSEPFVILLVGFFSWIISRPRPAMTAVFLGMDESLMKLIGTSLKSGALMFGTGLAIVPLLSADFVENWKMVSPENFMTAVAFGQMTPGPVLVTVTYIGFLIAGWWGATFSTIAVFLPSFFHMITWFPRSISWLSRQTWIDSFLTGVLSAVVATIVLVLWKMGLSMGLTALFIILVLGLVQIVKPQPGWLLILFSGLVGFVLL